MSIEKKSLISTLKTTKKANAVSSEVAKPTNVSSKRVPLRRSSDLKRSVVANPRMRRSSELKRNAVASMRMRRASQELKRK
ncbi:MAG TPA: hypothetical protein VK805_10190 [Candidatus Baltobacteraceae bacterium]|nr:hypothetical protein [Candidatus Baltobacteraceae bacterium]